ncbi:MAG: DUF4874 domain-containing protein, partial [Clostridia bacterium]|nr:DUF4874 domain-containing protein [Clostridia bacterium]
GSSSGKTAKQQQTAIAESLTFAPLTKEDDAKLQDNPDRGYRTEFVIYVRRTLPEGQKPEARTVYVDQSEEKIREAIQSVFKIYIYNRDEQAKLSLSYIYITDWREKELDDNLLNFFRIYFTMCREQKIKNMLRICYCTATNQLHEGADEKTIVRHTKQLKDVISEYADTIHTISCGFVGAYGEWAIAYQYPEVDYATVIKAIVENLAVPNNLYFSIRSPSYKNLVGKDYEHYWSISHNNDALFGEQKRGWESGGYEVGTPDWEQVTREGAYTPQGGEMFVNGAMIPTGRIPVGWEVILECYNHRHTSLSFWHGYLEAYRQDNVMKRWQLYETITSEKLKANGMIHDPNWFLNENGEAVQRNPYEFLRDHLGYRLFLKDAKVDWSGNLSDKINVEINLNNYGFAAAFNMMSGFALLDENYNVVSPVEAGEPKTWYNRDPDNPKSSEVLTHKVTAQLDSAKLTGTYHIAFYLKNTMGTHAALANKMDYENGYNIIHSFEVK